MSTRHPLTSIGYPVPELPVSDVERAQQYYKDTMGFEIGWLYPGKEVGAVSRGKVAIFFRQRTPPFEPAVHWVFAEDLEGTYNELVTLMLYHYMFPRHAEDKRLSALANEPPAVLPRSTSSAYTAPHERQRAVCR